MSGESYTRPGPGAAALASRRGAWAFYLGGAALFGLGVFVVLLGMSMRKVVNHDEHQFIAAGALIARQGLLPYVDFPYFHVPGLAFLYATLFTVTDQLLASARAVAVAAAWLMLALLFLAPRSLWRQGPRLYPALYGGLVVLLLMSTQTFRYTMGWAWNHDAPALLLVAACLLQIHAQRTGAHPPSRYFAIGVLMGLATAMRASFALPALAFAAFALPLPWDKSPSRPAGMRLFLALAAGGLVGSAPAWIFLLLAPGQFLFGNFEYVRLNTAHYLESGGLAPGQGWRQKWEMTRDTLFLVWRANLALAALTAIQLLRAAWDRTRRPAAGVIFLVVITLAALVAGYAPTPMQVQYIYPVFPLLALLNLALAARDPMPRVGLALLLAATVYAASQARQDFADSWQAAWQPGAWVTTRVHEQGQTIARHAPGATVVTLAPIYPLEGGLPILPGLVSGPFGWRVANLVDPATRERMGIIGPEDMTPRMATEPPAAILVGVHGAHAGLEPSLVEFAQSRGYIPFPVEGFAAQPATLWVAP